MLEDIIYRTKKVVRWFDKHKWDLLKGVLSMLTISFADGVINVDVSSSTRSHRNRMPEVKSSYIDTRSNSATAAIDVLVEVGLEASSDYYRREAAEKIQEILENTTMLTDETKQYAIRSIGKIKNKCESEYYKREISGIIIDILDI